MKRLLSNGLMLAGILSIPVAVTNTELPGAAAEYRNDPRLESLKRFFQESDCPARELSAEFLRAADRHNLDWRLLPSISLVESGGGRVTTNNNLFGWDGGRAIFTSVRAGIHDVASRLHSSRLYRDKDVDGILRTYNPNAGYPAIVKSVMKRISPSKEVMIAARSYSSNRTTK
ncbi:MAG TPA: hypothetical protein VL285_11330 [Bryobacteraceae bacterium]|jgi:hypothetical protein|nr:hypothetical protein [Bryobacteraceae bacterium]